jgi:DNA ligase (NAD+)
VAAKNLSNYFGSSAGGKFLAHLRQANINPRSDNYNPIPKGDDQDSPLAGKTFVITGTLSITRPEMEDFIEKNGGKVSSSISSKTSYLLAGEGGGSKLKNADKLGVPILDEAGLHALLEIHNQ